MLHLCTKDVGGCRRGRGHGPLEFHCDHFRVLSASDITDLRVSWFKEKVAKDDVKAEIEKLTGHEKVAPKRGSRKRPLEESTSDRDVERIPAEAEHPAGSGAVAEDLKKVRAEVDKEKRRDDENKDAHRRRRERPQHDEREKEKAKVKEREKEKEKEKKVKKPDRKAQDKGNWFGQKGEPQHSASESMDTKSDDTPRKAKRKKRKRRRAKQGDRGPFGVGRRVKFGEDESSEASKGSKSDGSGQVFQAAPSEKSRQLQLIEYSQQYPGRLAARLLTKMQDLLAREEGAMNPVGQNQTPATATSYYLTVVAPSYRDRMNIRMAREMMTIAKALDLVATGRHPEAADVLAQRYKALELQMSDQTWARAQHLELIPPEGGVTGGEGRKPDGHQGAEPGYENEGSDLQDMEPKRKRRKRKRRQDQGERKGQERPGRLEPELERSGGARASSAGMKLELRPRDDMVESSVMGVPNEPEAGPRMEEATCDSPLPEGTNFLRNRHDDLKVCSTLAAWMEKVAKVFQNDSSYEDLGLDVCDLTSSLPSALGSFCQRVLLQGHHTANPWRAATL